MSCFLRLYLKISYTIKINITLAYHYGEMSVTK